MHRVHNAHPHRWIGRQKVPDFSQLIYREPALPVLLCRKRNSRLSQRQFRQVLISAKLFSSSSPERVPYGQLPASYQRGRAYDRFEGSRSAAALRLAPVWGPPPPNPIGAGARGGG